MANRILGIEISQHSTRIIEVSFARRIKLLNFAVIENGAAEPARRVEQIQHTLRSRGFEARRAVVAIEAPGIEHRMLTLPVLSEREMHFVMAREARKLGGAESIWAYERLKRKDELGIQKDQTLLVSTEQTTVGALQQFFAPANIIVEQITTVPEAILNLMRQAGMARNEFVTLVVHFGGARAHVMFVEDGLLMMARDFPVDYHGIARDEQVIRLITEIKRSMLFFKQNFAQSRVKEIVYSGGAEITSTMSQASLEEMGVEGSVMKFDDMLDPTGFRGDFNEFRYHIPAMAAAIGAAWRKTPGTGINLVPGAKPSPRSAPERLGRLANIAAVLGVVLVLAVASWFYLRTLSVRAELAAMRVRADEVRPLAERAASVQQQRALARTRQAMLSRMQSGTDWLEVFRNLSFVVPESAVFDAIHIEAQPIPVMTIRGQMLAPSAAEANADFNIFFTNLRGLPLFSNITMSQPLTVASETAVVAASSPSVLQSRLSFEVRCELTPKN
jgi:Tfp pilus assembly PilM family ATPase